MIKHLLLALAVTSYASFSWAQDIAPAYNGELIINESTALPLQLNLGDDKPTLDSPAQGAFGIVVDEIDVNSAELSFSINTIQASFTGQRNNNGCYAGEFTQGSSFPLTLCPAEASQAKTPKQALAELPVDAAMIEFHNGQWDVERLTFNVPDNNQFEIGSVTKTMVAWLLASALKEGVVTKQTRLQKYWPDANKHVGDIRLLDIATHHSGLPRLPNNLVPDNINDPYADFGTADLNQAITDSSVSLPAQYEYSNFGYGLLAETLAKVYNQSFNTLLQEKLLTPLAMTDSYLALKPTESAQLISGERIDGTAVPHWHFDALAGAGAVISTVDDMVSYLQALMQPTPESQDLVSLLLTGRQPLGEQSQQAMGWIREQRGEQTIIWHNGQTAGFASFVGFTADGERGVVILSSRARSVTEIGKALL